MDLGAPNLANQVVVAPEAQTGVLAGAPPGFTMAEICLALVIIAMITAGIFVGVSMMGAAEQRTIIAERDLYTTAFKEFIDKYQALPGDMNNAVALWYSDDSCPNTPTNTTPKTPTCNGDGNGMIGDWTNGTTSGDQVEWFRAWQHLANSGIVEGSFTGVAGATSTEAVPSINVPLSRIGKGGWTLLHMVSDGVTDTAFFNSAVASHVLVFGLPTTGSLTDTPVMAPSDAKAIDEKVDDGMPFTGNVRVKKNGV